MRDFAYARAATLDAAAGELAPAGHVIAGGTNLLDLMKLQVMAPEKLVDITRVPGLDEISESDGGLRIGTLVTNSALAADPRVRAGWPLLSRAILAGASAQIRNKATTGGNLLQRTRCPYFYDTATACNKRAPGTGCAANGGAGRMLAIYGTSDHCLAAHPSDMAVALAALGAQVEVRHHDGTTQEVPITDLYRLPEDRPDIETILAKDDLITAVILPAPRIGARQVYKKVRDRASYAFALVSVAASVTLRDDMISHVRLAFGGVAPRPWTDDAVRRALENQPPRDAVFTEAADALGAPTQTHPDARFKTTLLKRTLIAALREATGLARDTQGIDIVKETP